MLKIRFFADARIIENLSVVKVLLIFERAESSVACSIAEISLLAVVLLRNVPGDLFYFVNKGIYYRTDPVCGQDLPDIDTFFR